MKNKKYIAMVLTGIVLLSNGMNAFAAIADTQSSDAIIKFEADPTLGSSDPVDPEIPKDKITPQDPSEKKGGSGNLTIDYITNLIFENGVITGEDKTYYAKTKEVTYTDPDDSSNTETRKVPNSVQVTDNRGNGNGWKLKVKQSPFTTPTNAALTGAVLTLGNAAVNSTVNPSLTPWPTLSSSSIELKGNNADVIIMTAQEDEGLGTYAAHFGNTRNNPQNGDTSVSLFVPGNSTKLNDTYTSTLVWTLEDTPN